MRVDGLLEEQVAEKVLAVFGEFVLLRFAAVVLEREDHRVVGREERGVADGLNHVAEEHFCAHGLPVRHHRLLLLPRAVPTVDLDAPAVQRIRPLRGTPNVLGLT